MDKGWQTANNRLHPAHPACSRILPSSLSVEGKCLVCLSQITSSERWLRTITSQKAAFLPSNRLPLPPQDYPLIV